MLGVTAVESIHEGGALRLEAIDPGRHVDHEAPESFHIPSCRPGVVAVDRATDRGIADGIVIEVLKDIEFRLCLAEFFAKARHLIGQGEQALLGAAHRSIV